MSTGAIIFCILLGAFFIFNYIKTGQENRMIESWPVTKGTILKTEFIIGTNRTGPRLVVEYEFFVNGKRYQSDYVYTKHHDYSVGGPEDKDKIEFLKNPEVKYNPLKPDHCCLILYPTNWVITALLGLGVILLLVGGVGLLFKFL